MDENFEYFLEKMGPAFDRRYVPKSSMDRYRDRLPNQLLAYWDEHGWCGYADGLFWTVDPHEYEPALKAWIGNTSFIAQDVYHVIARSAFGALYLWGERTGFSLLIFPLGSFAVPQALSKATHDKQVQMFFGLCDREENDFADYFLPALKKLGRLRADQVYGFVPALALGGLTEFENLQKLSAIEHLTFLAQLSELQIMATAAR